MGTRLIPLALYFLLILPAFAKDKKTIVLLDDVLRAHTVRVVIDPAAGEPVDQPHANAVAREDVEEAGYCGSV